MTVQDRITQYWDTRADAYADHQRHRTGTDEYEAFWAGLWTGVLPQAPSEVPDVGTGTGQVANVHARIGHRVTGTDHSAPMVAEARSDAARTLSAPPPNFLVGDAVAPEFPQESFDVITDRYLMWTLREPEVALENWRRLLRPGGVLAIVDSTWYPDGIQQMGEGDRLPSHYDEQVRGALPLAEADSIERTVALARAHGFPDTVYRPLHVLRELDERFGVAPHHEIRTQFLIVGHRAG